MNLIVSVSVIDTSSVPGSLFKCGGSVVLLLANLKILFRFLGDLCHSQTFMNSQCWLSVKSAQVKNIHVIIKPINLMWFHLLLQEEKLPDFLIREILRDFSSYLKLLIFTSVPGNLHNNVITPFASSSCKNKPTRSEFC